MLCGNFWDLELQTNNIECGSGVFSTVYCARKRVVLFGAVAVLLLVFSVTPFKIDENKNETHSIDYVQILRKERR